MADNSEETKGDTEHLKGLVNLGNIVLQPERVENATQNPDETWTYLIRWKDIWLHETLCANFPELVKEYWERDDSTPHNEKVHSGESNECEMQNGEEGGNEFVMIDNDGCVEEDNRTKENIEQALVDVLNSQNKELLDVFKTLTQCNQQKGESASPKLKCQLQKAECNSSLNADKLSGFSCDLYEKVLSSRNTLREHKMVIHFKNGRFPCDVCGKRFTHNHALRIHKVMHSNERTFKCTECNSTHKRKRELTNHIRDMHSPTSHIRCDVCLISFQVKADLKEHCFKHHLTTIHDCTVCQNRLTTPFSIYTHCLKHVQPKEFQCNICLRLFRTKKVLCQHKMTHDKDRKPFRDCPKCNKSIFSKSHFYEHLRSHDRVTNQMIRHACTQCDSSFKYMSTMKRHMLRHRQGGDLEFPKVNPFLDLPEAELPELCCKICRKNYGSKSGYYDHVRQCRDGYVKPERPCPLCPKVYANNSTLNRHMRQSHSSLTISTELTSERKDENVPLLCNDGSVTATVIDVPFDTTSENVVESTATETVTTEHKSAYVIDEGEATVTESARDQQCVYVVLKDNTT